MDAWEGLLLAAAALVAVRSLVHLARRRRDRLVEEVQRQVEQHREEAHRRKRNKPQEEAA